MPSTVTFTATLPGLDMNEGERVRWYLFGLGSENDLHTAHWHGLRVLEEGRRRTDVVELLPASMKVADMEADNPGQWLLHCHVAEHMANGMFARVTVYPTNSHRREPRARKGVFLASRPHNIGFHTQFRAPVNRYNLIN
jgi:FtsP/CotA-like multicopper oxidase with cupredoxin domain